MTLSYFEGIRHRRTSPDAHVVEHPHFSPNGLLTRMVKRSKRVVLSLMRSHEQMKIAFLVNNALSTKRLLRADPAPLVIGGACPTVLKLE